MNCYENISLYKNKNNTIEYLHQDTEIFPVKPELLVYIMNKHSLIENLMSAYLYTFSLCGEYL